MYVPRAMYSLRMSFWIVPAARRAAMPRSSATTMYIASSVDAVALIVIDVDTLSSGIPSSSVCRSSTVSIATPTRPTSPSARGESESMPICVGRSNATRQARLPGVEQMAEARVGLRGRAEAGVLAHRPQAAAVHRGCTPRVNGNVPGIAEVARVVDRRIRRADTPVRSESRRRRDSGGSAERSAMASRGSRQLATSSGGFSGDDATAPARRRTCCRCRAACAGAAPSAATSRMRSCRRSRRRRPARR